MKSHVEAFNCGYGIRKSFKRESDMDNPLCVPAWLQSGEVQTEDVKDVWRSADAVCFDVDSTVCVDEAIDEFAAFLGVGDKVVELTNKAMGGGLTYQESLAQRLNIMRPSHQHMTDFITNHPPRLTEDVKELMNILQERNVPIYLISGGFDTIIEKVAGELGIPKSHIYANKLVYYYDGTYAGFDGSQPTSDTGGKAVVIQQLKDRHGFQKVVHIGDGVTDMEACPPADAFIGFGGNQVRMKVKEGAKWFVTSFQELTHELLSQNDNL